MANIKCHECGRSYDYHKDSFCPHCGAFNRMGQEKREPEPVKERYPAPEEAPRPQGAATPVVKSKRTATLIKWAAIIVIGWNLIGLLVFLSDLF